ncbi:sulfatase family protein [Lutibacter citreus]|uniref:sulfatase family protein n=1 Tax=Lutibacter citreus TaxID=2138210 RepID=UPI000DBE50ED|nr:sulfatase [Lutibacter citreus]
MIRIKYITLLLFVAVTVCNAQNKNKRPNILFAFADDWGKYASCYAKIEGSEPWQKTVKTPNVDRIAREGVLFNNAYVSSPSCTPCRSSLLSGQHFYRTGLGAILMGTWDMNIPSYPLLLEEAGYHIGYTYKVWMPGTNPNAGYGGGRTKYEKAGKRFNNFSQNAAKLVKEGKSLDEAKDNLYEEVRQNFTSFLDTNKDDKPFCYWFGPKNVHRAYEMGSGENQWSINPDDIKGVLPPFIPDVPVIREDFADYLGEIQAFDTALGEVLQILEQRGELDNTLIVVSGDHGVPGFAHAKSNLYDFGTSVVLAARWPSVIQPNRIVDDFVSLPDLAPTFLELGGVEIPEVMTAKSLLPVFYSKKKSGVVDKNRDHVITGQERHNPDAREGNLPYPKRAIRTKDYLYIYNFKPERQPVGKALTAEQKKEVTFEKINNGTIRCFGDLGWGPSKAWLVMNGETPKYQKYFDYAFGMRPKEELYKISNDPHQINNLAQNPKYRKIKEELHNRLMAELKETKDPRVMGDGSTFDSPPYTNVTKKQ